MNRRYKTTMKLSFFLFHLIKLQRKCFLLKKSNIKSTLKRKNILEPEGQVFSLNKKQTYFENISLEPTLHYGKTDKIFKNKSFDTSCSRNDC